MSKAKQLIQKYTNENKTLSLVESITGGGLAFELTSISGSSKVLKVSEVLYQDKAKDDLYKIKAKEIYHTSTTEELARLLLKKYSTTHSVAVVGIAGPNNPSDNLRVGDVIFTIASKEKTRTFTYHFTGSRSSIRNKTIKQIIKELLIF